MECFTNIIDFFIKNIDSITISVFSSLLVTVVWIFYFRPCLEIESVKNGINDFGNPYIRVNVINRQCFFDAVNLNMEICIIENEKYTYHLDIDKKDFLILPRKKNRVFQSYDLAESAKQYFKKDFNSFIKEIVKLENNKIRVRIHANHSFTGFGKGFERIFKYDAKTEEFI